MLTLTLKHPPRELHPNGRASVFNGARLVKLSRLYAKLEAINAMNRIGWMKPPQWEKATTRTTFHFDKKRRRDGDNLGAWLKSYWDGIADAGVVVNDSGFHHEPPTIVVSGVNIVVIEIVAAGGGLVSRSWK